MEKIVTYMGQALKVACDERCNKAFGSTRDKVQLSGDEDDYYWLSDGEVGEAPVNPGTYEGGDAKPINKANIPNKWCIRECERCAWSEPGKSDQPLPLKDWSKHVYNIPGKHNEQHN